jgi:SAM-dependent methyltransferase
MSDTVSAYDAHAGVFAARYESVTADTVHAALIEFIPQGRDLIALDVGAGSGRDAAWLVSRGYEVVAAEPAAGMRVEGQRRHPDPRIRWLDDRLPDLNGVHRLGLAFDLILLSAVWMHVPPPTRARAFRKLATLLKPGGVILISLRDGPSETDRPMWAARPGEIEAFARTHGLAVLRSIASVDQLGRADVGWTAMCLRLPDDGAEALPLLRGIILNDEKASTYKLGLLRAVARVADATPALAMPRLDEDAVDIPLGNSDARVFRASPTNPPRFSGELMLDGEMLGAFGTLTVPGHIWRSLQRLGAWIEPVLVGEWARLVRSYGERMGQPIAHGEVEAALAWLDPARDTQLARLAAQRMFDQGQQVSCVWTGSRLGPGALDIDHCLPWSAWPCGDLWNLLPASPRVNQHLKRDRLPSASALAGARENILGWWQDGWYSDPALRIRFEREAAAALPVGTGALTEDVFAALEWRRLRLRQDQQVQEWVGVGR